MAKFYYQIKGKELNTYFGSSNWSWPPIFSGMVEAKTKKEARLLIEDEYGRKFPLRVLQKDLDNESYLLNIREITKDDTRTLSLFELKECLEPDCSNKFRVIDKYNDNNESYKGHDYCSVKCKNLNYERTSYKTPNELDANGTAVIYKITNVSSGMVYIGKTTQVFTLRWYQHFYQNGDCKFHQAIKNSSLKDWTFEIVEIVEAPTSGKDINIHIREREGFWIDHYNAIESGYNSAAA